MMLSDEEKAEKYALKVKYNFNAPMTQIDRVIEAYLAGLAEGRKEIEQWKQEWENAQIKANEEGYARTTLQIKYKELEKENKEILEDNDNLNKWVDELKAQIENYQLAENESKEIIAELKAHCKAVDEVNEKMKCCGNCINRGLNKDDISYPCCDCKHWQKIKQNDYWVLAE